MTMPGIGIVVPCELREELIYKLKHPGAILRKPYLMKNNLYNLHSTVYHHVSRNIFHRCTRASRGIPNRTSRSTSNDINELAVSLHVSSISEAALGGRLLRVLPYSSCDWQRMSSCSTTVQILQMQVHTSNLLTRC